LIGQLRCRETRRTRTLKVNIVKNKQFVLLMSWNDLARISKLWILFIIIWWETIYCSCCFNFTINQTFMIN